MKRVAQMSLLGFAVAIAIGAGLLMLPPCTRSGHISFVDALFTSASATCVTGLIVVDTGSYFTGFGQTVILVLIQAGGLGIMTLSTGLLVSLGRRVSIDSRLAVAADMGIMQVKDYRRLVWNVVLLTFGSEAAGLLCLLPVFWRTEGFVHGLWSSTFHSVSAFCNAGFSLNADSFCAYRANVWLNVVVCGLIVAGGIGFIALWDVWRYWSRRPEERTRLSLHTKLVIVSTGILIVCGTLLVWGIEGDVTMAHMGALERLLSAVFQSVTTRTAGFNTIHIDCMSNATLFGLIVLMFIGASPCSTGGGIKTTTVAVLVLAVWSRLRGRESTICAGRTLPPSVVSRGLTLALASVVIVSTFAGIALIIEQSDVAHSDSRNAFAELFFETVSAFGTVGLSMGVTGTLSAGGKVLITLLMYVGRVGPLALMLALSKREVAAVVRYPDEEVIIG